MSTLVSIRRCPLAVIIGACDDGIVKITPVEGQRKSRGFQGALDERRLGYEYCYGIEEGRDLWVLA
jgi:hypothetical protein